MGTACDWLATLRHARTARSGCETLKMDRREAERLIPSFYPAPATMGGMVTNPDRLRRLQGTWRHRGTSAEFTIRVLKTRIVVSGVDTNDGERFAVSDVSWDGKVLSFITLMPSTRWRVVHRVTPNRGSTIRHEFTSVETWTSKRPNA
jgi:hypothetical protein